MKKNSKTIISKVLIFTLGFITSLSGISHANIYKSKINPQWSEDNSHFWYRNDLPKGEREFIFVDLEKGERRPAFDHKKLAESLSSITKAKTDSSKLPIDRLNFDVKKGELYFQSIGRTYKCDLNNYNISEIDKSQFPGQSKRLERDKTNKEKEDQTNSFRPSREVSPDGKWRAFIRDHNIFIRAMGSEEEIQLSKDGKEGNSYQTPYWAINSKNLISFRLEPDQVGVVHLHESSPREGGRAKLHTRRYALPGDKFTSHELNWFDIEKKIHTKPEVGIIDFRGPRPRWTQDGRYFRYQKIDRGHQRFRVIEVDVFTGKFRNIIDEKTETFIWTEHPKNLGVPLVNWLDETDKIYN